MKKLILACLLVALTGMSFAYAQDAQTPETICENAVPADEPANREFSAPEQVLEPGIDYRAIFCTGAGAVYIDLFEQFAPETVNSFVFLAEQGYYNNTTFHRVLANFMAQGGDPTGTGRGGPGYTIPDEFVGFLTFDRPGWLAMANTGQPGTGGSQFFITTVPYSSLDFGYTIFGEVLEGQENVNAIRLRDPETATEPGEPLNTVVIITDPATVETTYEPPAPATREDVAAVIDELNSQIPETLTVDESVTGIHETSDIVAGAPADLQADFAAFLETYNHAYRAAHSVVNTDCTLDSVPYVSIAYSLDHFATREDAAAALADGFLTRLNEALGFTASEVAGLEQPLFTKADEGCDIALTHAKTSWQRGHFVVTAEVLYPADHAAPPELWLTNLVAASTYERIFSSVLRAEIR